MTRFVRDPAVQISVDRFTPIWRYQNLDQLLWMLTTGSLWFARADTLGDPYEGSLPRDFRDGFLRFLSKELSEPRAQEFVNSIGTSNRAWVRNTAVSCWHMSEHESAAMWNLYVRLGQGVAIRSTIDRFLRAIPEGNSSGAGRDQTGKANALSVQFGAVEYIDHHRDSTTLRGLNPTDPFFLKRKSFEHEREFRALVFDLPIRGEQLDLTHTAFPDKGVPVPVDLPTLIEEVRVPPGAPQWGREVVKEAIQRFGYGFPVIQSRLDEDPIF